MEEPKIIINTKMEKEDYKKFLYTATFKRNKLSLNTDLSRDNFIFGVD